MDPFGTLMSLSGICKCLKRLVGASGFEPPTSWSRTRRSSQAEPRPECRFTVSLTLLGALVLVCFADLWQRWRRKLVDLEPEPLYRGHQKENTTIIHPPQLVLAFV